MLALAVASTISSDKSCLRASFSLSVNYEYLRLKSEYKATTVQVLPSSVDASIPCSPLRNSGVEPSALTLVLVSPTYQ